MNEQEATIERIEDLPDLIARTRKAFKWIAAELAIASNVFPADHKDRKRKLAERMAVQRLIGDVLTKLELELAGIEAIQLEPDDVVYLNKE